MRIRTYQTGDEQAQARIYNTAAGALPAFKPSNSEEIARRYPADHPDPSSRLFALEEATGAIVGYTVFNPSGRISYPWCLPGFEDARRPLIDAALATMSGRGFAEAWTTYRADWSPVLSFFRERGFVPTREIVNFVAETEALPDTPIPPGLAPGPLGRDDLPALLELGRGLLDADDSDLAAYHWENPWFGPDSLFALREKDGRGAVVGAALVIVREGYADPTRIDPSMPCFRLGAAGTERERHKRVNGMVSILFADPRIGEALLAEAGRRLRAAGLSHAAAQAPSDRNDLISFYGRFFRQQGSFPILALPLATDHR